MKKFRISDYAPPGYVLSRDLVPLGIFVFLYLMDAMVTLSSRIDHACEMLRWNAASGPSDTTRYIVDPSVKAKQYNELLRGSFGGFWLVVLFCGIAALSMYLWFRKNGSICIMNRLPKKETVKRCVVIPLVFAAAVLIITLALALAFKGRYMALIPAECLPEHEPLRLFDAILPGGLGRSWLPGWTQWWTPYY